MNYELNQISRFSYVSCFIHIYKYRITSIIDIDHQLLPWMGFNEYHCPPLYVISPPTEVCVPPLRARVRPAVLLQYLHLHFLPCLR